jgi:hypothetical protein
MWRLLRRGGIFVKENIPRDGIGQLKNVIGAIGEEIGNIVDLPGLSNNLGKVLK